MEQVGSYVKLKWLKRSQLCMFFFDLKPILFDLKPLCCFFTEETYNNMHYNKNPYF